MSRRLFLWTAALSLMTAACTTGDDRPSLSEEFTTFPPDPTTTAAPLPPPTSTPGFVNRLVVIDEAGSIVTVDPDGANPMVIANSTEERAGFFQPLWAPGSQRLAWSEASAAGFALTISNADGSNRTTAPMSSPPFYFSWAPDASHVAALHDAVGGLELQLVEVGETGATLIGSGVPLYISWSPETADLAAHIGGNRLVTIELGGRTTELGPTAVGYQAPHWVSAGIIHLEGQDLELLDETGTTRTLLVAPGPLSFVANAKGTRLAVQSLGDAPPALTTALQRVPQIRPNVVIVIDLATGETTTVLNELAVAFFWSPDGEGLLIFGVAEETGNVDALVWDGDETRHVATFALPMSFANEVLPFF